MDTSTNQRQNSSLAINDLVLIKTPRRANRRGGPPYLLYQLERIDRNATIGVRDLHSFNPANEIRAMEVDKLYVFKPILNKKREKTKNYRRRKLPEEWLGMQRDVPYCIKLEDHIGKMDAELNDYKKTFMDFYTKLNAGRSTEQVQTTQA